MWAVSTVVVTAAAMVANLDEQTGDVKVTSRVVMTGAEWVDQMVQTWAALKVEPTVLPVAQMTAVMMAAHWAPQMDTTTVLCWVGLMAAWKAGRTVSTAAVEKVERSGA